MRYTVGLLLACICAFSGPGVLAGITEGNDPRYGTGNNTTIDTANRLEWLDWSVTLGPEPYDIAAQLVSGGRYEGWRLATRADMITLLRDLGLPTPLVGDSMPIWTGAWDPRPIDGLSYLGTSAVTGVTAGGIDAWYEACIAGELYFRASGGKDLVNSGYFTSLSFGYQGAYHHQDACGRYIGFALVRKARSVPEPSGLAMVCLAATLLMRRMRRR